MIRDLKRFNDNRYLKSVSVLFSGALISQLIVVFSSPIITRIYSAENIGVYTYILSITQMFMAVICGRYDMSIVTEEDEERVFLLIKLSLIITVFISATVSIAVGLLYYFSFLQSSNLQNMMFMIFPILFSYGVINTLSSYNNRKKEYDLISKASIVRAAGQNIGAILLGLWQPAAFALILSYTIGQFLGVNLQSRSLRGRFSEIVSGKRTSVLNVAKNHYRQPVFSAPALFINSLSYSTIALFIQNLYGYSNVGYYSISVRILGLPLALISGNIARVFYQEAADEYRKTKQFWLSYKKSLVVLTLIAVPMIGTLAIFAPWASRVFFGKGWETAGYYIRVLTPMFIFRFVGTALTPGLQVCKKQSMELFLQLLLLASSVVSYFYASIVHASIYEFLNLVSWSKAAVFLLFIFVVGYNSKKKLKEVN